MQRHRLIEKDPETRRGVCSICGPVGLKHKGRGQFACRNQPSVKRNDNRPRPGRRAVPISAAEYDQRLRDQDGGCAICGSVSARRLAVDHDHRTGEVRGLLCHHCNLGLGRFYDDPARLESAIRYLAAGAK